MMKNNGTATWQRIRETSILEKSYKFISANALKLKLSVWNSPNPLLCINTTIKTSGNLNHDMDSDICFWKWFIVNSVSKIISYFHVKHSIGYKLAPNLLLRLKELIFHLQCIPWDLTEIKEKYTCHCLHSDS